MESVPVLEIPYLKGQHVFCSFHLEAVVMKGLQNGHVFYSLNCIPENLVYDNETVDYPVTAPEILEELKQQIVEKFLPAFERALDFHESAAYLYENENQESPIIPFLLHQAVELTYRGILQGLGGCPNYSGNRAKDTTTTHTIRILQKLARCCAPQLNIVFPDNTGEEKRLLDLLEHAYADARYDNRYVVPKDDLSKLFDRVILLQGIAKNLVKEKRK
jgi:HEPN domain-containing protein